MGFWQNVDDECEYLGISRKELAERANFSVNTISNGIRRNGMPYADMALKISKVLNVPLEKLFDFNEATDSCEETKNQKLFLQYLPILKKIDNLQYESKTAILSVIEKLQ